MRVVVPTLQTPPSVCIIHGSALLIYNFSTSPVLTQALPISDLKSRRVGKWWRGRDSCLETIPQKTPKIWKQQISSYLWRHSRESSALNCLLLCPPVVLPSHPSIMSQPPELLTFFISFSPAPFSSANYTPSLSLSGEHYMISLTPPSDTFQGVFEKISSL